MSGENTDNLIVSEKVEETAPETEKPIVAVEPEFFINDDSRIKISIDIFYNIETGELVSVEQSSDIGLSEYKLLKRVRQTYTFKPLDFEDLNNYRQKSSSYRMDAGMMILDETTLRWFLLIYHLKDWDLQKDGKKFELSFKENGSLDETSLSFVKRIKPKIMNKVLDIFQGYFE